MRSSGRLGPLRRRGLPLGRAIEAGAVEKDEPEEFGIAQVAAPVALRFRRDPVYPFEAVSGHPARRPIDGVGLVIDRRADSHEDLHPRHRTTVAIDPDLLLRRTQSD